MARTVDQYDGEVRRYLSRNEGVIPVTNMTDIGTPNNNGAAAIGSSNVKQRVSTGADAASLAEFARVLLAAFDQLVIGDDLKDQVRAALEEVQSEAAAETAPSKLKAAVGKVAGFIAKTRQPALTAAFMNLATHLGLPPS